MYYGWLKKWLMLSLAVLPVICLAALKGDLIEPNELDGRALFAAANADYSSRNYEAASKAFAAAEQQLLTELDQGGAAHARIMQSWSEYYRDDWSTAEQLLEIFDGDWYGRLNENDTLFYHYSRIRIKLFTAFDDQPSALEHAEEALRRLKPYSGPDYQLWKLRSANSAGRAAFALGRYEAAKLFFEQGISYCEPRSRYYLNQLNNLAAVARRKGDYEEALDKHLEILKLRLEKTGGREIDEHAAVSYYNIGRVEYDLGRYKESIKSAQLFLDHFPREKYNSRLNDGRAYLLQANALMQLGEHERAVDRFSEAVFQLDFSGTSGEAEISAGLPASAAAVVNSEVIFALDGLAESQSLLGVGEAALATTRRCLEMIDEVRSNYFQEVSRYFFSERIRAVYDRTLERLDRLAAAGVLQEREAQQLFWDILERSKSLTLLEHRESGYNRLERAVSKAEAGRLQKIRLEIAALDREIVAAAPASAEAELLKSDRFKLNRKYEQGVEGAISFKASATLDLQEFQLELGPSEWAVSWFIGEEYIYSMAIGQAESFRFRVARDSAGMAAIAAFRNALEDQQWLRNDPTASMKAVIENGRRLYNWLLHKQVDQLKLSAGTAPSLILLPDGVLFGIPFSALSDADGFLVNKFAISYGWSGTLYKTASGVLTEPEVLQVASKSGVGIVSPTYSGSDLPSLQGASSETKGIRHSKKVDSSADPASVMDFLEEGFPYYHFAMHASFDEEDPMLSALLFPQTEKLHAWEIEQLSLNTELVVLSACETGRGNVMVSEGASGLSRAFYKAGAKTVISTLWRVDDAAGSELMRNFYREFSKGESSAKAIQRAKLSFMAGADSFEQHPYYWAGYICNGDSSSPASNQSDWWKWLLGGGILLILAVSIWRKVFA